MSQLEGPARSAIHAPRTSFIGRERERAEVTEHLMTSAVTTLTGPGGVGKTTLAMHVAAAVAGDFPDGARVVWLGALRDPTLVAPEVAAAVGLPRSGGQSYVDALVDWLDGSDVLLVLDNCEHVVSSIGDLVEELTGALPRLHVLATSREPLWVAGEFVYALAPLSLARPDAELGEVSASEAVQLFLARSRLRSPRQDATDHTTALVEEICQRLDGLPLAIELAAARVAGLELEDIAGHLDDLFQLLPHAARRADGERRSLRSTVEWSDALLDDDERVLLRRMAVFAGEADVNAIEGICAGPGQRAAEIADLTARLVEKSLLIKSASRGSYRMLETIRQYESEQLDASGEAADMREAHARWFLALGLDIGAQIVSGDEGAHIRTLTDVEDNVRLALSHLIEGDDVESGLALACNLGIFWYFQGKHREGIRWIEKALDRAGVLPVDLRAAGLFNLGFLLAHDTDDWAAAGAIFDQGIEILSTSEESPMLGNLLCLRGEADVFTGQPALGVERTQRGLAVVQRVADPWATGLALWNVGYAQYSVGDFDAATETWLAGCDLMREHQIGLLFMVCANSLGELAEERGDLEAARTHYDEALTRRREIGARQLGYVHGSLPRSMVDLARVLDGQGHDTAASSLLSDALPLAKQMRETHVLDEIRRLEGRGSSAQLGASLRFDGQLWSFDYDGHSGHIPDARGLWHLRELVSRPHQPIPSVVLAAADRGAPLVVSDAGPMLDREALRSYRQRLADLDGDLIEADRNADIERGARLAEEREALLAELARATGLGGRQRKAGSTAERARVNVTRTIRHAIKQLDDASPALAAHLDQFVRTGNLCAYEPDGEVTWTV